MSTYRFESVYGHQVVTLEDDNLILDGNTYRVVWNDNAEILGEANRDPRWGQDGRIIVDGDEIIVTLVWEQQREAEAAEDCCDWEEPDALQVEGCEYYRVRA